MSFYLFIYLHITLQDSFLMFMSLGACEMSQEPQAILHRFIVGRLYQVTSLTLDDTLLSFH